MKEGDDENPISESSSKTLETIFENGSEEYRELVLKFVGVSISQPDWKHRQASIKAFSLLLYGLTEQDREALLTGSINELMGLMGDASRQVQFAALDSFSVIAELSGKFVLRSPHFV
jgi:hypothetical protein